MEDPAPRTVITGDTLIVSGGPSCGPCEILLRPMATLGDDDDPVSLSEVSWMTRTSDGRYFLTAGHWVAGVLEYSPSGRFQAVHGREGDGPGEYRRPHYLASMGDTVVVFDVALQRFTFVTSEGDLLGLTSSPIRAIDFVPDGNGNLLLSGLAGSSNPWEQGLPVHRVDRSGTILESLGDSLGPVRPGGQVSNWRSVSVSDGGVIAVGKTLTYELLLLFPDGEQTVIVRDVEWFPPEDPGSSDYFPLLQKTWIDPMDRLWVAIRSHLGEDPTGADGVSDPPATILEVFDIFSGELLASRRFDLPLVLLDGLAYTPEYRVSGDASLRVFAPELDGGM